MTKVYFIGSHCSGKTTLARYVSQKYELPMITEVARSVLAEMEISLSQLRVDLDLVNEYQRRVFERQLEEEELLVDFVSDRAFDNVAYAAEHSKIAESIVSSKKFKDYLRSFKDPEKILFFVRPHASLFADDGVRETPEWASVCRIDGMVKFIMESHGIPYVNVSTPSMQERTATVDFILRDRFDV